jgi:hypothetical protein
MALFRELPGAAASQVLLCTDLHGENILAAEREPWLVIDPKPYAGDPADDVLQHMLCCEARLATDPGCAGGPDGRAGWARLWPGAAVAVRPQRAGRLSCGRWRGGSHPDDCQGAAAAPGDAWSWPELPRAAAKRGLRAMCHM